MAAVTVSDISAVTAISHEVYMKAFHKGSFRVVLRLWREGFGATSTLSEEKFKSDCIGKIKNTNCVYET